MGEFKPVIVGFLCRWCASAAADLAGTSRLQYPSTIRPIRVNCSSMVDPVYILRALLEGADGVLVGACHPGDCHYVDGNLKERRRIAVLKNTLGKLGLQPERVRFEYISTSEGLKFARVVEEFTRQIEALGPNPLRGGFDD
ncbi:MAG TPA: hydrogenase iron-sulfur subunit [Candidatus Bathyarchaeota archaeon]|nr:hydrogenase iron-sulfur subunit [Candidatus Bathyarchaeota archaeon]